jgi:isoamyl acetate esterase
MNESPTVHHLRVKTNAKVQQSGNLNSFEGVPVNSRLEVEDYIGRINFAALQTRANECHETWKHQDDASTSECFINPSRFAAGYCNLVFELRFGNGTIWMARVWTNHYGLFNAAESSVTSSLQSEIQTMQYISDHSRLPVPKVFDYELDPQNPVNFRFIIMETVVGRPLGIDYSQIPPQYLTSFLDQLADYVVQLGTLSFSSIGRIEYDRTTRTTRVVPPSWTSSLYKTSTEYVQEVRSSENKSLLRNEIKAFPREDRELACWVLMRAALGALRKEGTSGPFPLSHPDLHQNNIMVDDDYKITGIIDWSGVQTVPQEVFAAIPGFRYPSPGDEEADKFCREAFTNALREREHMLTGQGSWLVVSEYFGSDMAECINKALTTGVPWRGVHYARYLLPMIFGEAATWAGVQEEFEREKLAGSI